jgi:branched-chain amino acid transport system substrate-binding protein
LRIVPLLAPAVLLSLFALAARAQDIVVAQVAPFSGGLAQYSKEISIGASAMFKGVNARGGIKGQAIRLSVHDDHQDPPTTLALYDSIARAEHPVAFMYPIGPLSVAALLQGEIPQHLGIPLIGSVPAMDKLRTPVNPYVFNVGVGNDAELAKIVEHMTTIGIKSIGVVYWDEPSARDAVTFIEHEASARGARVMLKATVPAGTDRVDSALAASIKAGPGAIIAILPVTVTGVLVKKLRQEGNSTPVYGASYTESAMLAAAAGEKEARGVGVSQVVPNPFNASTPIVRDYQQAIRRYAPAGTRFSTVSLEGYIAARILVEAISNTTGPINGATVRSALERLANVDLGGLPMSFGPGQHVALRYLDIGVVSQDGRLIY